MLPIIVPPVTLYCHICDSQWAQSLLCHWRRKVFCYYFCCCLFLLCVIIEQRHTVTGYTMSSENKECYWLYTRRRRKQQQQKTQPVPTTTKCRRMNSKRIVKDVFAKDSINKIKTNNRDITQNKCQTTQRRRIIQKQ